MVLGPSRYKHLKLVFSYGKLKLQLTITAIFPPAVYEERGSLLLQGNTRQTVHHVFQLMYETLYFCCE